MIDPGVIGKILLLTTISFIVAITWTPFLTHILYKYKIGKSLRSKKQAPIFHKMHEKKAGTPTMGGILIWLTVFVLAVVFLALSQFEVPFLGEMNFLTRGQTLLPLGALVASGLIGMIDDLLNVRGIGRNGGGIHIRHRLALYSVIAITGAWWFYDKLDWDLFHVPFVDSFNIGWWYIPLFILVIVGTSFSVNQTDGLDGLAGGTLVSSFSAFAVIALFQERYELAVFCGVIVGALLAFLWFNIYPARFFMGDTGAMSLGVTLAIVAMLTNTALFLPIIGFVFVVEAVSTIIQILSKKILKRKVFKVAPIHHHFEAKGWPEPKVVMRFWVISWIAAALGIVLFLLDISVTGGAI
ncbi:phospho-N-acetylmuramoyl-pentapeptide-transferase [Candidatus Uhrbacteria bacterium]|jgi:phospho-N-acetylmuramoyl-pentapeptide-transferase|nr:phospho-N-acetylmuramoyl-pentapeptide-transferase [Candidatus Uhrbacteria bacterium]MBT7716960.1 phospho-N-acetylmuramoyl-pentapeptide-transferase [Candidatus Uhrbacteria bacterium]